MRLTKAEKQAALSLLEWMTDYHNTECEWLDPDPQGGGGYHLQSVRDKLRTEIGSA